MLDPRIVDAVSLGILLLLALRGLVVGFVSQIASMAGILLGILGAAFFSSALSPLFETWLGPNPFNQVLAFLAIAMLGVLIGLLLKGTLKKIVEGLELRGLDRFLGLLLGLVEAFALIFVLLFLLQLQQIVDLGDAWKTSIIYSLASPLLQYAESVSPQITAEAQRLLPGPDVQGLLPSNGAQP